MEVKPRSVGTMSTSPRPEMGRNNKATGEGTNHHVEPNQQTITTRDPQGQSQTTPTLNLNKPPMETIIIPYSSHQPRHQDNQRTILTYRHYTTTYPTHPDAWSNGGNLQRTIFEMILQINGGSPPLQSQEATLPCITYLPNNQHQPEDKNGPLENTNYSVEPPAPPHPPTHPNQETRA